MRVRRGDVVMVDWMYSDRTGSKVRPAVVVQVDFLNGRIDDTILVSVTSRSRAAGSTEVPINPASEPASGLRAPSVATCTNITTYDHGQVMRIIGSLSVAAIQQIETRLKYVLGLP
jgi:mRNA-degrading endonuclease toxin of MazEF toxin-antitoxin module